MITNNIIYNIVFCVLTTRNKKYNNNYLYKFLILTISYDTYMNICRYSNKSNTNNNSFVKY